jgi:hypothetical protein
MPGENRRTETESDHDQKNQQAAIHEPGKELTPGELDAPRMVRIQRAKILLFLRGAGLETAEQHAAEEGYRCGGNRNARSGQFL